jgi:hypothetical protein
MATTIIPGLIPSFCGRGVPEYPAMWKILYQRWWFCKVQGDWFFRKIFLALETTYTKIVSIVKMLVNTFLTPIENAAGRART